MTENKIAELANTTTTTTTEWVPPAQSDYASLIIDKAQVAYKLATESSAAAVAHVKAQGTGKYVTVRIMPKRTAQGPISEGGSLTDTADTTLSVDVELIKYGDYNKITGEAIRQTKGDIVAKSVAAMARGLANKFDDLVWTELETLANATTEVSLAVSGDLTTNDDFAKKLLTCIAEMQKLDVQPDHIAMGPDQLNALRQTKAQNAMLGAAISLDAKGEVVGFAGCKVINMMSIANANAATADLVHACVWDSSRAYGLVFADDPIYKTDEIIESDIEKHVFFAWMGVEALDADGIGVVKNAAA